MKKLILGLLTLSAINILPLPVQAGDGVVVQDARQTTYQTGDYNYTGQTSLQHNRVYRRGVSDGHTGDVMTSDQLSDQYGTGNRADQRIRQENIRNQVMPRSLSCNNGCNDN
jgi:hypothetical protein